MLDGQAVFQKGNQAIAINIVMQWSSFEITVSDDFRQFRNAVGVNDVRAINADGRADLFSLRQNEELNNSPLKWEGFL